MIYPKLPNSLDPLPPTPITTDQLFNLPRIPYFYSVTPYPLTLASSLDPPSDMKRRYNSDDHNSNDPLSLSRRGHDGPNGIRLQQIQQGSQELSEGAGADDDIDHLGVDMIEGRVLKKMKRIKLSSESPPSDLSDMFTHQLDTHALGNAVWNSERNRISTPTTSTSQQLSTQPHTMDSLRPFAPIKISTKAASRQESAASLLASSSSSSVTASSSTSLEIKSRDDEERTKPGATLQRANDSMESTSYARMNTLLHQAHASRFGIPHELPLADDDRTLPAQNEPSAPESRQHSQDPAQAFTANAAWQQHQQQQQQQQQQTRTANTAWSQQSGGTSISTAWYQQQHRNAILAAQMMDEDDEMADVNETHAFSPSLAHGYQMPQGVNRNLDPQQGYVLNQHPSHQHQQQHQQQQQQQSGQTAEEHNLYHTINSQLRAAFLARSEMDKRYR